MTRARCRLGFERRVDAAIYQPALKDQNAVAVIGTRGCRNRETGDLLSSLCVERHIRFLRGPEAMEQERQLTRYCNYSLIPRLPASSGSQVQAPLSKCRVSSMRSKDVVGTPDQ